jgi:large subunit ribosomal protein L22
MINNNLFILIRYKYLKFSPNKLNIFISKLSKKTYSEIYKILLVFPKKISNIILKLINSSNFIFNKHKIIILNSSVNKGPILKRSQPRAKGKSYLIQKKMSHITISISNIYNYITLKFLNLILLTF